MVVRIKDQKNVWGKTLEPNRSDLWKIDFSQVTAGLGVADFSAHYYATGVVLPRLSVKPQEIKERGIPVLYPSWDEPPSEIKIDFIHDIGPSQDLYYSSRVYALLQEWQARVRSGRSGLSTESTFSLDENYKMNHAFDINVELIKGFGDVAARIQQFEEVTAMEISAVYVLKDAWLSSFQLSDLNYDKTGIVTVNACFYARNVLTPY